MVVVVVVGVWQRLWELWELWFVVCGGGGGDGDGGGGGCGDGGGGRVVMEW